MSKPFQQILLLSIVILSFVLVPSTKACGCGLALSDMKTFNALKETQAYLLIDVLDEQSYNEMPFFRMVSMDEPYNVTIVFPMDGIPYDVVGRTIPAKQFLEEYRLNDAEDHIIKQNFNNLVTKLKEDLKSSSRPVFALSNGFSGLVVYAFTLTFGSSSRLGALSDMRAPGGLVAHFEFEGGSLDIYNVSSMQSLDKFVQSLSLNLTGKVEELVMKYKDYYVAVLYLKVPSALSERTQQELKLCPEDTEKVKQALQTKTSFNYAEISELTSGPCRDSLRELIHSVIDINANLNGTLVNMKFKDTNQFFYPTSIVNSYKYPITEQKYFVKTPTNLQVNLQSSRIDNTANFDNQRWYQVVSTEDDLKGTIVQAGIGIRFEDKLRSLNQLLYENTGWIIFFVYLIIFFTPFIYHYFSHEKMSFGEIAATVGTLIIGGFLLTSIVLFFRRKPRFAAALSAVWGLLLILAFLAQF